TTATELHQSLSPLAVVEKALPAAGVVVAASGVGMALLVWGWTHAWIDTALVVLLVVGGLAPLITGRRGTRIRVALASSRRADGVLPQPLLQLLLDPVLLGYSLVPAGMGLGIVALMVFKPDWNGSLLVVCAALAASLVAGQLALRWTGSPPPQPG